MDPLRYFRIVDSGSNAQNLNYSFDSDHVFYYNPSRQYAHNVVLTFIRCRPNVMDVVCVQGYIQITLYTRLTRLHFLYSVSGIIKKLSQYAHNLLTSTHI